MDEINLDEFPVLQAMEHHQRKFLQSLTLEIIPVLSSIISGYYARNAVMNHQIESIGIVTICSQIIRDYIKNHRPTHQLGIPEKEAFNIMWQGINDCYLAILEDEKKREEQAKNDSK